MKRQAWKRMQAWLLVVAMFVSVVTGIGTTKTAKAKNQDGCYLYRACTDLW